jgi:predicted AAA+ superfamily ATPase
MYTRLLPAPHRSFFLFGPRGSGKTTWLKQEFPDAKVFNLLQAKVLLELSRDLGRFKQEVLAEKEGTWIILDEVQKLPRLLDDVHDILNDHDYKFALSGSSARKLKRLEANMLAGRAITRKFFPLVWKERAEICDLETLLRYGNLPEVCLAIDDAIDILEAYVGTYLKEEIAQESLDQDLDSFTRFLQVAGILNGSVINISGVARDCGVKRETIERYYEIAESTLIGTWIRPLNRKLKVKESSRPKFYFFDPGVVRGLTGRLRDALDSSEKGALFETLVLHELNSAINYLNIGGTLNFWETSSSKEVDFIWSRANRAVGFEVKTGSRWRSNYGSGLKELLRANVIQKAYGVYEGDVVLKDGEVTILTFPEFAERLATGQILT